MKIFLTPFRQKFMTPFRQKFLTPFRQKLRKPKTNISASFMIPQLFENATLSISMILIPQQTKIRMTNVFKCFYVFLNAAPKIWFLLEQLYFSTFSVFRTTKMSVYNTLLFPRNNSGEFFETLYCVNAPRRNISGTTSGRGGDWAPPGTGETGPPQTRNLTCGEGDWSLQTEIL